MPHVSRTANRTLSSHNTMLWGTSRIDRHQVREERLKGAAGLRDKPYVALSAWRGISGRRYVVQVLDVVAAAADDAPGCVFLGVRRAEDGLAILLGVGHAGTLAEAAQLAALDGATEIHIHRLADTFDEREAIVVDLVE